MSREKITPTGKIIETQSCISLSMTYHNPNGNEACVVHVVSVLVNGCLVRTRNLFSYQCSGHGPFSTA